MLHALCWLHAERSIRKLVPLSPREQEAIDGVRDAVLRPKLVADPHLNRLR
jgi:hypothetical protein